MKFWDDILQTALIGTTKKPLRSEQFPPPVAERLQAYELSGADPESLFLKGLALSAQLRRSGALPLEAAAAQRWDCPAETQPVCSERSAILLQSLLSEGEPMLVHFWLDQCYGRRLRVPANLVAPLLQFAVKNEALRDAVAACCGFTGNWLANFNSEWDFAAPAGDEQQWRTGKAEQRLKFFRKLRKQDPARARALLMETWEEENAHHKANFLDALQINLSNDDLPWLEQLQGEKAEKVRAARIALLKQLPGSTLVRAFAETLNFAISIMREKIVFGLGEQLRLTITPPIALSEELKEAGFVLEKKEIHSGHLALVNLFRMTPPGLWANRLTETPQKIISLFEGHAPYRSYLPSILEAAINFRDLPWIEALAPRANNVFNPAAAAALPVQHGLQYAWKHFADEKKEVVQFLQNVRELWDTDQARRVLRFTTADPYSYNKNFYRAIVWQMPEEMRFELGAYGPENTNYYWNTVRDEIEKILSLKAQVLAAF